jgi:benzoyl-CoA reductase/2-hydroxyglutaryl-CoA dehydratase subunit BcrC/BadD/HgdB
MVENYFAMPPCPTRGSPIQERIDFLIDRAHQSKARGIIFCGIKFCEPELFDMPLMAAAAKEAGLKTLLLDLEVNQPVSGQLGTRVEAFIEMMR